MSFHMPQARRSRSVRSWLASVLTLVAVAGAIALIGAGPASAAAVATASSNSGSGVHVFGIPLGAAIWVLLGLVAVVVGVATVGSSRSPHAPASAVQVQLDEQVAVAAA